MLLKQKMVWIGAVIVLIVLTIFGMAMMGSVLSAKPNQLPVGLVVQDKSVNLPDGSELAIGEMIKGNLQDLKGLPVKWKVFDSKKEANEQLDDQQVYGVLVLPSDLSKGVMSLASPKQNPATAEIIMNEGMNAQASAVVKQVLNQVIENTSLQMSKQVIQMVGNQTNMLPTSTAESVLNPIKVKEKVVHPVGDKNAGGNAPNMLVQIMWMGSLITSIVLFLSAKKARESGAKRWTTAILQAVIGLAIVALASAFLVWMASSWYGMELQSVLNVWLFLLLAGVAFFLLQSALLNLIGLPAMAILILLLFFSLPVVGMAPEFLPDTTRTLLFSWTPFRYATEGLRSVMYFDGGTTMAIRSFTVLGWMGTISLVITVLSGSLRKVRSVKSTAEIESV